MKRELYLVLETSEQAYETLKNLKDEGFNATVLTSESLRHAVDYYPGEHHFFNLRHLEEGNLLESILCLFVVEEDRLNSLKNIIRKETNNFSDIKGFMYSHKIEDYEGSI